MKIISTKIISTKIISVNKKARHEYEILETLDAGIVLLGDEVKSIRAGQVSLKESYATVHQGEIMLLNCNITPYAHAYSKDNDIARRTRKLLLHKKEIDKIIGAISRKGLTIIPLKLYINDKGYVKLEIGIARHKKAASKKRELKEKDIKRDAQRQIKTKVK